MEKERALEVEAKQRMDQANAFVQQQKLIQAKQFDNELRNQIEQNETAKKVTYQNNRAINAQNINN